MCLFNFSCVRPSGLWLYWSVGRPCSTPSPLSDSGTCTQDLCRRNVHTDMWPQLNCEAEVRGFPVFEGQLLVFILCLDHITPNLCLCPHRETNRSQDLQPSGLGGDTHDRLTGEVCV